MGELYGEFNELSAEAIALRKVLEDLLVQAQQTDGEQSGGKREKQKVRLEWPVEQASHFLDKLKQAPLAWETK